SGSAAFVDVSGFTRMTEVLSTLGSEGGEVMSRILNRYFTAMIGTIHLSGGQVMKFGGDALLCFFPGKNSLARALLAADKMRNSMRRFQNIRTPIQKFALQIKIGVAEGEVLVAGIGDPKSRSDFVFAGEAVDLCTTAEKRARPGEVVIAENNSLKKHKSN